MTKLIDIDHITCYLSVWFYSINNFILFDRDLRIHLSKHYGEEIKKLVSESQINLKEKTDSLKFNFNFRRVHGNSLYIFNDHVHVYKIENIDGLWIYKFKSIYNDIKNQNFEIYSTKELERFNTKDSIFRVYFEFFKDNNC